MRRIALNLAMILTIMLAQPFFATTHIARAQMPENEQEQLSPAPNQKKPATRLSAKDAVEINFVVRSFLWALDGRQAKLLDKFVSPAFRAGFSNPNVMLLVMTRIHRPVMGAERVFIYLPTLRNGMAVQTVYLLDAKRRAWKTTYILRRDASGHFKVIACVVTKLAGKFS